MKIILVTAHTGPSPQAVPLATGYLKASVSTDQHLCTSVTIMLKECLVADSPEEVAAEIRAERPDAVGFSMYVWNRAFCTGVAALLKGESPITLFAGGPEVTADAAAVVEAGFFDFVIIGEGEEAFKTAVGRMLDRTPLEGIPGLLPKQVPTTTEGSAPMAVDLDKVPSPYLDGTLDAAAYGGVLWQLSRGCGFRCDFCFDNKGRGGVRYFPLQRVEEELRLFAAKEVRQVFVLDSTFNLDRKRAKAILRMIAGTAPDIHFHFEIRSEFLDREMVELFSRITCSLQIGLQSTDSVILHGVNRHFDLQDFRKRISMLNECGIIFGFDLMYGLPGDSLQTFRRSLDEAISLYPNHLDIFPLAVLPGTPLAKRGELVHLVEPPYTILKTPAFSPADLKKAAALAEACTIFYTRGKAVAWFNSFLAAMAETPSEFLSRFSAWMRSKGRYNVEEELSDREINLMQRDFLRATFREKGIERLLPLAQDVLEYHYQYGTLVLLPQVEPPKGKKREKVGAEGLYRLHPSARLVKFNFDIYEILDAGEVDLEDFARHHRQRRSYGVMYPGGGEVRTEALERPYFNVLEKLKAPISLNGLTGKGLPSAPDVAAFVAFLMNEGIVVREEDHSPYFSSISAVTA